MRQKSNFSVLPRICYSLFLGASATMLVLSLITSARFYPAFGDVADRIAMVLGHSGHVWFFTTFGFTLVPAYIAVEVLARTRARELVSETVVIVCVGAVFACYLLRMSYDAILTLVATVLFVLAEFSAVMSLRGNLSSRKWAWLQFICYYGYFWYFLNRDFPLLGLVPILGLVTTLLWFRELSTRSEV